MNDVKYDLGGRSSGMDKADQIYRQLSKEHKGLCAPPQWLIKRILEIAEEIKEN